MYRKLTAFLLFLALLLAVFAGSGALAGSSVPLSIAAYTLEGEVFDSSVLKNYDLVVLNLWAEWCYPCRSEMPDLDHLNKNYPNVLVIGVYVDSNYAAAQQAAAGLEYPMIRSFSGIAEYITFSDGYYGIPQTMFFDRNGMQLEDTWVGSTNYSEFAAYTEYLLAKYVTEKPDPEPEPEPDP